jgi:hypothetical protein
LGLVLLSVRLFFLLEMRWRVNVLTSSDVVLSAMVNRYTPYVTIPYYIALGSQLLASLYAYTSIRETLRSKKSESDADGSESGEEEEGILERAVERVTVPVRPLRVLMPWRDERGVLHWELAALAVSLFATTCGVRSSVVPVGGCGALS